MKILLFGTRGKVGTALATALRAAGHEVMAPLRIDCDISDPEQAYTEVLSHEAPLVINAAAMTGIEACETEPHLAFATNVGGPQAMAAACRRVGSVLIHFSTDYVFEGWDLRDLHEWSEEEEPKVRTSYGWTKLVGEQVVQNTLPDSHLIFRVSTVYDTTPKGPLDPIGQVMRSLVPGKTPVKVLRQFCRPTSAKAIASAIERLIRTVGLIGLHESCGVYHLATKTGVWRTTFIEKALESYFNMKFKMEYFSLPIARPIFSSLNTDRFERMFGADIMPDWYEDLHQTLSVLETPAKAS